MLFGNLAFGLKQSKIICKPCDLLQLTNKAAIQKKGFTKVTIRSAHLNLTSQRPSKILASLVILASCNTHILGWSPTGPSFIPVGCNTNCKQHKTENKSEYIIIYTIIITGSKQVPINQENKLSAFSSCLNKSCPILTQVQNYTFDQNVQYVQATLFASQISNPIYMFHTQFPTPSINLM